MLLDKPQQPGKFVKALTKLSLRLEKGSIRTNDETFLFLSYFLQFGVLSSFYRGVCMTGVNIERLVVKVSSLYRRLLLQRGLLRFQLEWYKGSGLLFIIPVGVMSRDKRVEVKQQFSCETPVKESFIANLNYKIQKLHVLLILVKTFYVRSNSQVTCAYSMRGLSANSAVFSNQNQFLF